MVGASFLQWEHQGAKNLMNHTPALVRWSNVASFKASEYIKICPQFAATQKCHPPTLPIRRNLFFIGGSVGLRKSLQRLPVGIEVKELPHEVAFGFRNGARSSYLLLVDCI
ncbi:hypothetical protein PsorP6_017224 [Peronosclerospora sorghi]|uniref:Uncharacterized protein n=1 Tax=Peronosclerospora sorghi TaxID=230839 RepID=A0ACC0WEB9_9STRA|nr:hypothetical protein PsorP6_017224 [Peronosclerospora sorghi]